MRNRRKRTRRGAVVVLVAILLIPLLAMLAFTLDVGYIVRVKAELQNSADSAALAGAAKLMTPQFNGVNSSAVAYTNMSSARAESQLYAGRNSAGNTTLSLASGDVVIGYLSNPSNQSQTLSAWSGGANMPNSVQVLMRRDNTLNNPVQLFFARVLGVSTWSGTATATASFFPASNVTGFKSNGPNAKLLPITIDVALWNSFLSNGLSPDGTRSDNYTATLPTSSSTPPSNVSSGADNIPEFNDGYPNPTSPGNFGLISIGPPSTSEPTYGDWINSGATAGDLSYFGANGLQATPSAPATISAGPGLKSSLVPNLADAIGQPRAVPLFSTYSGNGANAQYTIVGFAGVTIVSATGSGSNIQVVFQPSIVIDPTATTGSSGGSSFIYSTSPVKLTR